MEIGDSGARANILALSLRLMVNNQGHSVDTLHDGKMEGPVVSLVGAKTRGNINLTLLLGYDGLVGRVMAIGIDFDVDDAQLDTRVLVPCAPVHTAR